MKNEDYVKIDLAGYPYNAKYEPDYKRYGSLHHGYRTDVEETLFYDFAVQRYDLSFRYNGNAYYFVSSKDHVALCDENFTKEFQRFDSGNDVLELFQISGKPLIDLINELEEVEAI